MEIRLNFNSSGSKSQSSWKQLKNQAIESDLIKVRGHETDSHRKKEQTLIFFVSKKAIQYSTHIYNISEIILDGNNFICS